MKMQRVVAACAVFCLIVFGSVVPSWAHEGHDHKILGTVTMAAADHVMVKDKDGKDVTVYLKADTKIVRAKIPMKIGDVAPNMRVVITAVTEKDKGKERMVAKSVELGAAVK